MVKKGKEKIQTVDLIQKDGQNFVKLRDLEDEKISIDYENKIATVTVKG